MRAEQLRVLNELGQGLLAADSCEETFHLVRIALSALMPLDLLQVYQETAPPGGTMEWRLRSGSDAHLHLDLTMLEHHPGGPLLPEELRALVGAGQSDELCQSHVLLPMRESKRLYGYILIGTRLGGELPQELLRTIETVAGQTTLWINSHARQLRERAQTQYLEAVFARSSDAILMMSAGRIARANPSAIELLGTPEALLVGKSVEEVLHFLPLELAIESDAGVRRIETPGGVKDVQIFTSASPLGQEPSSILTLRDVTVQRELDRAKASFVSMVSHELRTPLNSVLGFSDVLLSGAAGSLTEHQEEFLGHIRSSSRHLVQLVNDILDLSRLDAGAFTLGLGPVLPSNLAQQVVGELSALAVEAKVQLTLDTAPDVPMIQGDGRRIEQVLINLTANALKFTPDGGSVHVSVTAVEGEVVFAVEDDGPGIPPEEHERIFERFYQPVAAPRLATKGSGLGLTIAKRLVEQHHGRIWLTSEVGCGSKFYFALPVKPTKRARGSSHRRERAL